MTFRILTLFMISALTLILPSCLQCITGGQLHIKRNYVSNVCGLLNGVDIKEIKVDSFENDVPVKYVTLRSAFLYRQGASPNNDPQKLYFNNDCKEHYLWDNGNVIDTVKGIMKFKSDSWYVFSSYDTHTKIYMFIDKSGERQFEEVSDKSGNVNF